MFDIQVEVRPPSVAFRRGHHQVEVGFHPKEAATLPNFWGRKVRFENKIRRFEEENQWLEDGVGPWNSLTFTVPKPNDDRVVIDYRCVNDCTQTDAHPLLRIEDILLNQGKFKIWSVLDIKDGYHQVPLKKEDRHITCFSTPRGTLQWTVLAMGLKNAGAIFQRMMVGPPWCEHLHIRCHCGLHREHS